MTLIPAPAYCDFLGIPCPSVAGYVCQRNVKPIQLFTLAILVHSRPMAITEVADYLQSFGWLPATGNAQLSLTKAFGGRLPLVQLSNGTFDVELNCIELRMQLFELGIQVSQKQDGLLRSLSDGVTNMDAMNKPNRLLIYGFHSDENLVALTLLDLNQRSMETLYGESMFAILGKLKDYSVLIALNPRNLLDELGIKDVLPWRMIDLAHHPKSKQINKRGRKLAITTELLITSSTGISKPLGDPIKMQDYWREGKRNLLTKRMESNTKSLFAFYSYGAFHNTILLRWGFLSDSFLAEWGVRGEPSLYEFMKQKAGTDEPIEFVRGSAPGWNEPWSRGKIGTVLNINHRDVELKIDDEIVVIPRDDIQAARCVRTSR